jgi:predicted dehydrogenase
MTLRVLVVGCGQMGSSHARAYHAMPEFEIVGLVSRGAASRRRLNADLGGRYPEFSHFEDALAQTEPDAVCISTYTETHAEYATAALAAGAHVFLEKPVADTNEACAQVIAAARGARRALVVGYILQVHPAWQRFTEVARVLGFSGSLGGTIAVSRNAVPPFDPFVALCESSHRFEMVRR